MKISWMDGYEKYKTQPGYRKLVFKTIIEKMLVVLRNIDEIKILEKKYDSGNSKWCVKIAKSIAPNNQWAWDLPVIEECAYAIRCSEIATEQKNKPHRGNVETMIEIDNDDSIGDVSEERDLKIEI